MNNWQKGCILKLVKPKISRRNFIFKQGLQAVGLLGSATVGIYAVGSAFKSLDGSLVAGAKGWSMVSHSPSFCIPGFADAPSFACDAGSLGSTAPGEDSGGPAYCTSTYKCLP